MADDSANLEQRSAEWLQSRLGKVTASRIADMMARAKSGYSASRANYAAQLIAERLTGQPQESYTNAAMQHGVDTEPEARANYEFMRDCTVGLVGFIAHPTISNAGASPDGIIGADGLLEIKCPGTAKHLATLQGASIDDKYVKQMMFQMACTGRTWCDFVSYDPRLPARMRLFIKRVPRDDRLITEIESEAIEFLAEIETALARLAERYGAAA